MSSSSSSDDENIVAHAPRRIIERININFHEAYFLERFRLSPPFVEFLENRLANYLQHESDRNNRLTDLLVFLFKT